MQKELLSAPGLSDELNGRRNRAGSSDGGKSSDNNSSEEDDLLEEFKRETERDLALSKEREETRQQKLTERKK